MNKRLSNILFYLESEIISQCRYMNFESSFNLKCYKNKSYVHYYIIEHFCSKNVADMTIYGMATFLIRFILSCNAGIFRVESS